MPLAQVRRLWPDLILGASVHSPQELEKAAAAGADYAAAGSLYPTSTKGDATPLSHDLFRKMCAAARIPLIGIGGITVGRVPEVVAMGAAGVAVIQGLWSASDAGARASEYAAALSGRGRSPDPPVT
jgi:thiamine-phosphate pyrophosphorylase